MGILVAAVAFIPLLLILIIVGAVWRGFFGMLALDFANSVNPELFPDYGFGTCFLIALVVGMFVPTSSNNNND